MLRASRWVPLFTRGVLLGGALLLCLAQAAGAASRPPAPLDAAGAASRPPAPLDAAGAAGTKISGNKAMDGGVRNFQVAPNGEYAVYETCKLDSAQQNCTPGLFSVSLRRGANGGPPPVPLTSVLPPGYGVAYAITPDSSRVVYSARQYSASYDSLYTISIQGGAESITRWSAVGAGAETVRYFAVSPDGRWLFFETGEVGATSHFHLYRVSLDDGGEEEILFPGATSFNLFKLQFSPDSQRLFFLGQMNGAADYGIYSMPASGAGSQAALISKPIMQNMVFEFKISPDSRWVVYPYYTSTSDPDKNSLFIVPVAGPASAGWKISGGSPVTAVPYYQFSPDSQRLVFEADRETTHVYELFSSSVSLICLPGHPCLPPLITKLSVALSGGRNVDSNTITISPNSELVAYNTIYSKQPHDLFVVPIDGGNERNVRLNYPLAATVLLSSDQLAFSPDSTRLIYTAMQDTTDLVELYSIPVGGPPSAAVKLNPPIVMKPAGYGMVQLVEVSPDGKWVIYQAETQAGITDLFKTPLTGPASASENLSGFTVDGTSIASAKLVPGKNAVLYTDTLNYQYGDLYLAEFTWRAYLPAVTR